MPGAAAAAAEPPAAAAAGAQAAAGARGAAAAAGQAQQQQEGPELYRFWSPLEVQRLLRCVEEPAFRREELGSEAMDWRAIATHFKRSVQAVRSKYRLEQLTKEDKASGQGPTRGGPRASISYGYMALFALASLPERSGTGEEVCAAVEAHGPFQPLLDRTFRQDSVGVPKWKQRIREELSHRSYFINTRQKRGGETIWQLESSNFDAMPPAQLKRLAQALPGLPLLGKRGLPNG
ncbi:forkhead box M1 [Chlorella sorokiniana]|uniref:Forkhead box M1 n=1 Tax=Chlorella sorokiniana TaxID=3076 RepID=A0A2P6TBB6_CHLSO|nr:forkhead box M1 [Chlorella sorokiniana]|eukprot:PRW05845.1 forkhead box M1 [Chlorella sorokiniana]